MISQTADRNVPVVEALLDIKTTLPESVDLNTLQKFQDKFRDSYPNKETKVEWKAAFQIKQNESPVISNTPPSEVGFIFNPPDKSRLVQARFDGFTFNQLKPYTSWEEFSTEAKTLWEHYVEITNPINITRIAVRYINRIEIPLPIKTLDDYLNTRPVISAGIPQTIEDFFMRITIAPTEEKPFTAIITEAIDNSKANPKILPLILDIDVFKLTNMTPTDKEIWNIFEEIRLFKNEIFINSITDETKKLFKL